MQSGSTPSVDDKYKYIETPGITDMQVQLENLVQQGAISPEEAQTVMQNPSAMNGITLDPKLKENQMAALQGLSDISDNGGMTTSDKVNLSHIKNDEAAQSKGAREAILQNAQSRGMGGSGLELLAQLQNQQDSAGRQSQRDLGVAGQAQDRALQALIQQGTMSGNIANQDFGQQSQVAGANDAISRFNAQNQQNQLNLNNQNQNAAQAANTVQKQSIADQNVGLNNQEQQYNKGLYQQNFNNQLAKTSGSAQAAMQNAQAAGANSTAQANANNQLIGTGLTAAATIYGGPAGGMAAKKLTDSAAAQKTAEDGGLVDGPPTEHDSQHYLLKPGEHVVKKEDVPRVLGAAHTDKHGKFDVAGFLDDITGHKYNYKGKK